jgi:UTP--glucose-1-phosphate uridylyltransferase
MNTISNDANFEKIATRMQAEGLPDIAIDTFKHHYTQLCEGHTGLIAEADIEPVQSLPDVTEFESSLEELGKAALSKTLLIKLNGGLGTSMGLNRAKSLIKVRDDLSFLDVIAKQAIHHGLPLVLMNSFATRDDSIAALEKYSELTSGPIPLDFVQHKVPKIRQDDLLPVDWQASKELEWCPPGHGDIYTALVTSGLLEDLISSGKRYAFVSNADNLGAVMDFKLLGYFSSNNIPFMMEVADRNESDKKGGHIAKLKNGQLILRESAQCAESDMEYFQNINRHRYFNTNNLWIDLEKLKYAMEDNNYVLGLSLIRNSKTVDPRDPSSALIYQLESAMGSAISVFKNSQAVRVSRKRFAPVKTTNDLLLLRSDLYELTEEFNIVKKTDNEDIPTIDLDSNFYKIIDDFESRFADGMPSLATCRSLTVTGDVKFNSDVSLDGDISLVNLTDEQKEIDASKTVKNGMTWSD